MPVALNNPITQADLDALALLANTKLLPLVNAGITAGQITGLWTYDGPAGSNTGGITSFDGANPYDVSDMATLDDAPHNILNPQPAYVFNLADKNWRSELNRMRGDYYFLLNNNVTGASAIFNNPNSIVSGPWIVDVNDPATFPRFYDYNATPPTLPLDGVLRGSVPPETTTTPNFCAFNNVEYWFADKDAAALTVTGKMTVTGQSVQMTPTMTLPVYGAQTLTFRLKIHSNAAGTLNIPVSFSFDLNAFAFNYSSGAPTAADLNFSCTPSFGTLTRTGVSIVGLVPGVPNQVIVASFAFAGTLNETVVAGDNDIVFSLDIPAPLVTTAGFTGQWFFGDNGGNQNTPVATFTDATLIFSEDSALNDCQIIHPTSAGKKVSVSFTGSPSFTVGNAIVKYYSFVEWKISDTSVKGIWTAKTLPVPGQNVFLDQDFPPFVNQIYSGGAYPVAIGSGGSAILASTMRTPAIGDEDPAKFGKVQFAMAARPAPYQVLRSTDFVPWDYGYPVGSDLMLYADQTIVPGTMFQSGIFIPTDATNVKFRLRQPGAKLGWKAGVFQYGEPLASTFTIYVKASAYPTTSVYDFKVTSNDLTIDPDGALAANAISGSYLARAIADSGFYYAIENTSGSDVVFDLITEIDTVAAPSLTHPPTKQYFPIARECFSYCLQPNAPANLLALVRSGHGNDCWAKPIPQSGYCIFKLRATRLPVANAAGIAVTPTAGTADVLVTIGQHVRQPDNSLVFVPLQTISANGGVGAGDTGIGGGDTGIGAGGNLPVSAVCSFLIPAGSRDSGDLAVFFPVLGGNEIVYKCDQQIIVEAWANWQPIFFNAALGNGLAVAADTNPVKPAPTQIANALAFVNMYQVIRSGYPLDDTSQPVGLQHNVAAVQFPLSIEIYNDLETCLNLIP